MTITNSIAFVTGANRGIGAAFVDALLDAGAARVYAAARQPISHADPRVIPITLDVTDAAAIKAAADKAGDVTLLINNAGALEGGDVFAAGAEALERQLAVNTLAPLRLAAAFAPALRRSKGAIVNILSVVALAPMPGLASYSASKAAAASLTGALRATLAADGVAVHGVFPGPVDTDMAAGIDLPKTSPVDVARAVLAGVEAGTADIFPDAFARQVEQGWFADPRAVALQFAA
ncbi:SDR family NAD(P)-dependent oxidoreductase [Sandarakinorhabdus oryzae]|uniref:SDR family NAD(P)-dependent oxidoreductase n=1 Tax=Sandarakinorhabdus oryzae TaxID=2675220 RepID=UPI0012E2BC68|nr:SDR family NAD(P)-dependent oxidoreductase [Sandarakinorhabdus oryzae]